MKTYRDFILEYDEYVNQLEESVAKRKIVVRKGKKVRKYVCPDGWTRVGKKSCRKTTGSEKTKRRKSARKSARTRKSRKAIANKRRKRSMKRRRNMGLDKRKKKK